MRRGDFSAAWAESDVIARRRGGPPPQHGPLHLRSVWDGTPLAGRDASVLCYHGLGDTIQFSRYLPMLAAVARSTTVYAQASMLGLLRTLDAPIRLEPLPANGSVPRCLEGEVPVELMELPWVFRSTVETIPGCPYLQAEPSRIEDRRRPRVGIVWRAGSWHPERSLPFTQLLPLLQQAQGSVYSLQLDYRRDEWHPRLLHLPRHEDPAIAARHVRALDLVISVDTMILHLAGALGVRAWALLHHAPDWRWMDGRTDSPWYPTMTLFRQERAGEWGEVMGRVCAELGDMHAAQTR